MSDNPFYKSAQGEQAVMAFYDHLLSHWPVQREEMTLSTRYGDTFVAACGDKASPPLVLVHGSTSNSATWGGDVADLSRVFRVYTVDIPGEPGKSAPVRMPWNGDAPVEWLHEVLDGLGVDHVSLGGMSLGGWLVLRYAAAHPERVGRLVLICPGGVAPARISFIFKAIGLSFLGRRGSDRLNRVIFAGCPLPPEVNDFSWLVAQHFKVRTDALPLVSDEELASLAMPTLLLMGGRDALLNTEKTVARLRAHVPNLTAEVFPEDGHGVINKTDHLLAFLTR